jgi:transposase
MTTRSMCQDEADRGEYDDRPTTEILEENGRLRAPKKELRRANQVLPAASACFEPRGSARLE